jgi:NADH dehydrogenase
MATLFITGVSGFIGTNLLRKLNCHSFRTIYCLSRKSKLDLSHFSRAENIRTIKASIFDYNEYAHPLASSDIVVHLAAVTGKAKPEEYFRVNAEGTKFFIRQCEKASIKKFIFLSTIAVNFKNVPRYHYAQSKKIAEEFLKQSRLNYVILRPTIVVGKDSTTIQSLFNLNKLPFILVFGDGRTKIQPIYIDDLVDCISTLIYEDGLSRKIFEIGGPEIIEFEDFLKEIYLISHGKYTRTVHIPLRFLRSLLRFLQWPLYSILPITVGQLSAFDNDGTVAANTLFLRHLPQMINVKRMLNIAAKQKLQEEINNKLARECDIFCRYLIEAHPNEYVLQKYQNGHKANRIEEELAHRPFDRLLLCIAISFPLLTKLVDSYTRVCAKQSILRKKLILLLAILETSSPYHAYLDGVDSFSRIELYTRFLTKMFLFPVSVLISIILFGPLHLAVAGLSRARVLTH